MMLKGPGENQIPGNEREKRSTDHPVTYTVPTEMPPDKGADVGLRTGLTGIISAGIALIIQKTLYPEIVKHQPANMPVTVPPAMGFFTAGFLATTAIIGTRPKVKIQRRHFVYSLAAGMGAGIGYMLGAETDKATMPELDVPDETPIEESKGTEHMDMFEKEKCEQPGHQVEADPLTRQ